MTPEELGTLTLADLEAMATRLEGAARTIRDAMTLLHGAPQAGLTQVAPPPVGVPRPAVDSPDAYYARAVPHAPPAPGNGRKHLPPIDRNDPERAALLGQFAKDGEPVEAVPVQRVEVARFGGGT